MTHFFVGRILKFYDHLWHCQDLYTIDCFTLEKLWEGMPYFLILLKYIKNIL